MLAESLRELIDSYVAGAVDIDDFSQQFASLYFAVHRQGEEPAAAALCGAVVGPLAEYSRGHRSESSLRLELEKALISERSSVRQ